MRLRHSVMRVAGCGKKPYARAVLAAGVMAVCRIEDGVHTGVERGSRVGVVLQIWAGGESSAYGGKKAKVTKAGVKHQMGEGKLM